MTKKKHLPKVKKLFKEYIGLEKLRLCPEKKVGEDKFRFMGIIAKNREEWAITALACIRSSITIVPFFESLGV